MPENSSTELHSSMKRKKKKKKMLFWWSYRLDLGIYFLQHKNPNIEIVLIMEYRYIFLVLMLSKVEDVLFILSNIISMKIKRLCLRKKIFNLICLLL